MKYICTQCTGRSGEEHTFHLDETPKSCPYHGCPDRHIRSIEQYLRQRLDDMEFELELKEDKVDELKEEKKELQERLDELEEEYFVE